MDYDEIINRIRNAKDDDPIDDLYTELGAGYNTMQSAYDSAQAKIAQLRESEQAKEKEINRLKGRNYDLLEQVGKVEEKPKQVETTPIRFSF